MSRYILDFYCHTARLVLEIDGGYHFSAEQKQHDLRRTADLLDLGIREIRFTNQEVIDNLEKVLADLLASINHPVAE